MKFIIFADFGNSASSLCKSPRCTHIFCWFTNKKISIGQTLEKQSPITLNGDTAHLMSPFAGQDVNIGLTIHFDFVRNLTKGKFETIQKVLTTTSKRCLFMQYKAVVIRDGEY